MPDANYTYRAIRFRLHPGTKAKRRAMLGLAGACRYVWNFYVGMMRDEYAAYGKCDFRFNSLSKRFAAYRKTAYAPWLRECSFAIVRASLKPIKTAYKNFFRDPAHCGLPRFHGKFMKEPSFPVFPDAARLKGDRLRVAKIGWMKLSRKGGNPYAECELLAKSRATKASVKIRNARADWAHKESRWVADRYDIAVLESLIIRSMTKSAKGTAEEPGRNVAAESGLNRGILASVWGRLEQNLSYKVARLEKIDPRNTSRECSECGHTDKANRKSQSLFACGNCGHSANADTNAALNILGRRECGSVPPKGGAGRGGSSGSSVRNMGGTRFADFAT